MRTDTKIYNAPNQCELLYAGGADKGFMVIL